MKYVESLNLALHELMGKDHTVYLIGEDLLDPYGGAFKVSKGLSTKYPDRVITTPISESGIVGACIGMAMRGLKPITEIMFGDFLTLCADQIINCASKFRWMYNEQITIPIVIRTPMGGGRGYGATHSQTLESMYLSVPHVSIVAPSLLHNPGDLLKIVVNKEQDPVLFIEHKISYGKNLISHKSKENGGYFINEISNKLTETNYPIYSVTMCPGEKADVTLAVYGGMLIEALTAIKHALLEKEIIVELVVPSKIKPVPVDAIVQSVQQSGRLVVLEEGNLTGGWGAELAALVQTSSLDALKNPIKRVATPDTVLPSSGPFEKKLIPSVTTITKGIYEVMK